MQSESSEGRGLEPAEDGKYYISSAEELREFAELVNSGETTANARLTADINLSGVKSWSPIGNGSGNPYIGTFDGDGHTISGLNINDDYQGLFGYLGSGGTGTVKNLTVDCTVSSSAVVGGIVAQNYGTIQNCTFSGTVSGDGTVGGIVGQNNSGGTVENCYNTGNISGNTSGGVVGYNISSVTNCYNTGDTSGFNSGGVVGWNGSVVGENSGSVENCYNTGEVSGNNSGGVVGQNGSSGTVENCYNIGSVSGNNSGGVVGYNNGRAKNCYNTGSVSGPDSGSDNNVGGVVGYNYGRAENCYNTGSVTVTGGSGNNVGGVVGYNTSTNASVTGCYNTGSVSGLDSGSNSVGGVVGYNNGASVTGCYFLKTGELPGIGGSSSEAGATGLTADDFKKQESFSGWTTDFGPTGTWTIHPVLGRPVLKSNPQGGLGTDKSPYQISTADELKNFATAVNSENGDTDAHAKLMNNISLNPEITYGDDGNITNVKDLTTWEPIGSEFQPYTGTFNGNGHKIENLYINNTDRNAYYQGLFGYVGSSGGKKGTVQNLTVSGSVSSSGWYVGGVVGYNNGGTVTGCTFSGSGSVTGFKYVGGVVGWNSGNVTNCYNTGGVKVTGNGGRVGGVVGYNNGPVKNCYNTGSVSGLDSGSGNSVGGVVGSNYNASVENCYNIGKVTGSADSSNVGGVVGYNYGGSVENCYNTGSVSGLDSGSGNSVGGVVGYNISSASASVTNCYFLQTDDVNKNLQGIGVGSGDANEKDNAAFHSGEVAYLLQKEQKAPAEGEEPPLVWGQTLTEGDEKDDYPQLVVFDADALQVYKVAFMNDSKEHDAKYANHGMSVDLPATNPTKDGYTFTGWLDANNQQVSGTSVTITADTKFTAQWQQNISVTAPTFTAITEGDPQPAAKSLTITNSGNTAATISSVVLSGDKTAFILTNTGSSTNVPAGDSITSYTIQPAANLAAGTYTATITVTYDNGVTATAEVSFTVKEPEDPDDNPSTPSGPSTPSKPSGPSTGDSTGWADILDELENAENGDKITIDMGDETEVPAEIFAGLAGKEVEVIFDLGDVQWSASGETIPTDTDFTDINLGVDLGTSGIPVNVINAITGEVGTVQITLAHNGEFGFTLTLTAPLGKENAGYWANLYHFDESAEALNFEAAAKIDETGSVSIPFSHASQYAIVIDTHSHARVAVSDIFTDVAPNAWYTAAIQYAYDQGLMTGVSDTEFAPEQTTTRAMIVSILARLENVTTAEAAGFTDVSDEWYATAVNWAASENIVAGFEDGTFRPNAAITREQLAAILMNYAACIGQDVSARADLSNYSDQPSAWAEETMQWAVAEKLITGVTNDELQPQSSATRAQVAAILQRFLTK